MKGRMLAAALGVAIVSLPPTVTPYGERPIYRPAPTPKSNPRKIKRKAQKMARKKNRK